MKTCPYCAEDIQPAATVCKHCHRNLVPLRARPLWRWARGMLIALGLWVVVFLVAFYNSEGQQQRRAFLAQREAWHRQCWPVYPPPPLPAMREWCAEELRTLQADARRYGLDPTTIAR
jgi:hypothetical protein